jgi:hypothetical protein
MVPAPAKKKLELRGNLMSAAVKKRGKSAVQFAPARIVAQPSPVVMHISQGI